MNWKKTFFIILAVLLLVSLIFNGLQFYCLHNQNTPECIQIHDTIVIHKDSIITKTKWKTKFDTIVEIHYKDTILYDTIEIPIEHKQSDFTIKKDSLTINETIWHSGYHSSIDSIKLDYNWNYEITKTKPKKLGLVWNIGPYIGYGVGFNNGQYYFSPEVGIGGSIGLGGFIK